MRVIVTAGPTYEPIDPVRFIGNRSSGKQGYAIAKSLSDNGFDVTLISGPTHLPDISGITMIRIETAKQMLKAVQNTLLSSQQDIAICAAAVADWAPTFSNQKIKKGSGEPQITFTENPDILKTIATAHNRPTLVIGFAAETENLIENAAAKLKRKSCDWILANDVSPANEHNVFGGDNNHIHLITNETQEDWQTMSKIAIADKLTNKIQNHFENQKK